MPLGERSLRFALPAALASLATVLAKTAYLAGAPSPLKGVLAGAALLGWLWLWRRVRAWARGDRPDAGRA